MGKKVKILTVCSNGLGSSLMLKSIVDAIVEEKGFSCDVETSDYNSVRGKNADYIITVKEFAQQMENLPVVVVRSYINRKKIEEDLSEMLKAMAGE